nr:ATP synthase F0 subunit 8 [Phenacoccus manihoti]UWM93455.1 ATP synthase F0 subunit 8 [Phenacoccus manihoti]
MIQMMPNSILIFPTFILMSNMFFFQLNKIKFILINFKTKKLLS